MKSTLKNISIVILILIVVALIVVAVYFFEKKAKSKPGSKQQSLKQGLGFYSDPTFTRCQNSDGGNGL